MTKNIQKTQVVIVDEKDRVLGLKEKFATHKNPVALHRAISIVIFDKKGRKMLLQKRSKLKPTWPLYWSNTCCSHPYDGETYQKAAKRRLFEEMGIKTTLEEKFAYMYAFEFDETWGEHELDHVFVGTYEGPVKPDLKEAADWKWIDIKALRRQVKKNPEKFTPWFKMILTKLKI